MTIHEKYNEDLSLDGLEPGDEIAVTGVANLREGLQVSRMED